MPIIVSDYAYDHFRSCLSFSFFFIKKKERIEMIWKYKRKNVISPLKSYLLLNIK